MDVTFSDGAKGSAAPDRSLLTFDCAANSTSLFAWVEARAAYTPVSGETITIAAEIARN